MSSFHYDFILSKRSSLAKVWLAAHWEKKLSKVQVFETNLQSIVQDILNPKTPIALRTSSHLLVGLVRIYSRKAKYLLKDCSDTLVNIKVAFRPGVSTLDKPVKRRKTVKEIMDCPLFITEKVDLLDQWIPEVSNVEIDCTLNQSKVEEITLQEEPMKMSTLEDYFDDEGFGEMDIDATKDVNERSCSSVMERGYSFADSAYGTDDAICGETFSLTDCSDPFSSLTPVKDVNISSPSKPTASQDQLPKLLLDLDAEFHPEQNEADDTLVLELDPNVHDGFEEDTHRRPYNDECETRALEDTHSRIGSDKEHSSKQSFDEDCLVLDPIENTHKKPHSSRKRLKRKLLIDEVISIERAVIFDNLNNPSRHLKPPAFAPRTKRQMRQTQDDLLLLSRKSFLKLPPSLETLFHHTKCRELSSCSDVSDDTVVLKPASENNSEQNADFGWQMNESEEFDFSAQFIPLQDVEYSSDEESPMQQDETLTDLGFTQSSLPTEETEDILMDENISGDKFCAFVETTVLQSQPRAVKFQEIVGSDGKPLTRKTVARRFVKCLIMQRDSRLILEQDGSFKDIFLHPGLKHATQQTNV